MQNSFQSLTETIKAKTEAECRKVETLTREQLETLSKSLQESSQSALRTTEAAISVQFQSLEKSLSLGTGLIRRTFAWTCLRAFLIVFCALMGAGLGSWALLTMAQSKGVSLQEEIVDLNNQKSILDRKAMNLWNTFKGLEPLRQNGVDYLLVPTGWTLKSVGTVGAQEVWQMVQE